MQSIVSVSYVDAAGDQQTLDETDDWVASLDRLPGEIAPVSDWPGTKSRLRSAVTIDFIAGYGDTAEDVPADLIHGLLLLLGHKYENRQEVVTGTIATQIPQAAADIFLQHRMGDEFVNYEAGD